jgi:hypothetical protein
VVDVVLSTPVRRREDVPAAGGQDRPGDEAVGRLPRTVHGQGEASNLSFAFRGNDLVREAMHSAFLYHAVRAGTGAHEMEQIGRQPRRPRAE